MPAFGVHGLVHCWSLFCEGYVWWGTVHGKPATNEMSYIFDLIIMAWVLSIDLPSVILFPMRIRLGLVVFQFPGCGVLLF